MRVGIVTETYPPEINGVALTVHGLAEGLAAAGHDVEVVRPRQAGGADAAVGDDLAGQVLVRGMGLPRYPGLRFGLPAPRLLARRWSRQRPDAVYIATEGPLGWSALRIARRLGIPAATGFHTRFDAYAAHYGVAFLTPLVLRHLRRFHRRAAATLVPTRALADELQQLGVDNARVLHRAVDTDLYHPARRDPDLREAWGVAPEQPVLLYVGRIAAEKNLPLAVDLFRAFARQRPDARFVWVGDGPERAALAAANPDFLFAGMRRDADLARHYASADAFVFPSLSETFGNVVLEALASGLPVVAYDEGAAHAFVQNGHNGWLAPSGDAAAFLQAGLALTDPRVLQSLRDQARSSVAGLAPDAVVADFAALLEDLAARAAARTAPAAQPRPIRPEVSR